MNRNDLYIKYAEVIQMCKDTALEHYPYRCVKDGDDYIFDHPSFKDDPNNFKFAVAILENKAVFVGDVIYYKCDGEPVKILDGDAAGDALISRGNCISASVMIEDDEFTWDKPKPKRTFKLNDLELPCPANNLEDGHSLYIHGSAFLFESADDGKKVRQAISNLLIEARDKQ